MARVAVVRAGGRQHQADGRLSYLLGRGPSVRVPRRSWPSLQYPSESEGQN